MKMRKFLVFTIILASVTTIFSGCNTGQITADRVPADVGSQELVTLFVDSLAKSSTIESRAEFDQALITLVNQKRLLGVGNITSIEQLNKQAASDPRAFFEAYQSIAGSELSASLRLSPNAIELARSKAGEYASYSTKIQTTNAPDIRKSFWGNPRPGDWTLKKYIDLLNDGSSYGYLRLTPDDLKNAKYGLVSTRNGNQVKSGTAYLFKFKDDYLYLLETPRLLRKNSFTISHMNDGTNSLFNIFGPSIETGDGLRFEAKMVLGRGLQPIYVKIEPETPSRYNRMIENLKAVADTRPAKKELETFIQDKDNERYLLTQIQEGSLKPEEIPAGQFVGCEGSKLDTYLLSAEGEKLPGYIFGKAEVFGNPISTANVPFIAKLEHIEDHPEFSEDFDQLSLKFISGGTPAMLNENLLSLNGDIPYAYYEFDNSTWDLYRRPHNIYLFKKDTLSRMRKAISDKAESAPEALKSYYIDYATNYLERDLIYTNVWSFHKLREIQILGTGNSINNPDDKVVYYFNAAIGKANMHYFSKSQGVKLVDWDLSFAIFKIVTGEITSGHLPNQYSWLSADFILPSGKAMKIRSGEFFVTDASQ
jgi:hypothetical protein